jgi:hypothetical protein
MRIGLDFDNTIVRYDDVFCQAARDRGLIGPEIAGTKSEVRCAVRRLPGGERKWQALQGYVYGRGIANAVPSAGLPAFLRRARESGDVVVIISHKTERGHFDPDGIDLRAAALGWMAAQGFFSEPDFSIAPEQVHFLGTRAEKLERIGELACDVFVDDLAEVLLDPAFPVSARRILFSDSAPEAGSFPYCVCRDWHAVSKAVFDGRD